ncbi:hypothetical protein CPT_Piffle_092 [Stenotrophomonas phage Piffle]|uniref:Uncharacterized protein n=1 Tax=Stenotrophomonas phage Piffle TaxID=2859656 RepID=A0AAE8BJC7_9CAUD|nr:hypothetical protein PP762_gp40 [Stenotrophomonas phage Piffle]QYW01946.1 hypothetical protein CPT_Piffle_092 [Stenotrophomonas phage Piffle]
MSTAPRVTIEQVEAAIREETYTVLPDGRTTICQLTLDNGFTVDGHSACVSKENFNPEIGNKFAREEAVKKVWAYLGFRLADRLAAPTKDFLGRMKDESAELNARLNSLLSFLQTGASQLDDIQFQLLQQQATAMQSYFNALSTRIAYEDGKRKNQQAQ